MTLFDRQPAEAGEQKKDMRRIGVLLVDDEVANLEALAALLEEDYLVHTASSARSALVMLANPAIGPATQIVVTDQRMPGMTGVDLLSQVRMSRPDIKGLLLTGFTDPDAIIGAINEAGVYGYLQKPVDIQELKMMLLRASEAWELERDNRALLAAWRESCERLSALDLAKTSFLSYLAHEVNTPLNWLAASAVIEREALGEESRSMLDYVDHGRQRLYGLVTAVLRYFEGAGPELRLEAATVDVAAMLSILAADLRRTHDGQFLLRVEAPEQLVVETDRKVLGEILCHLLENAVTHAVRGGGSPEVVLRLRATGAGGELEVHNSGVVPDEDKVRQIFQPFFFCGSEHGEQGFGLSLATARVLAMSLGGTLNASRTTVTDGGLCLLLQLPPDLAAGQRGARLQAECAKSPGED